MLLSENPHSAKLAMPIMRTAGDEQWPGIQWFLLGLCVGGQSW